MFLLSFGGLKAKTLSEMIFDYYKIKPSNLIEGKVEKQEYPALFLKLCNNVFTVEVPSLDQAERDNYGSCGLYSFLYSEIFDQIYKQREEWADRKVAKKLIKYLTGKKGNFTTKFKNLVKMLKRWGIANKPKRGLVEDQMRRVNSLFERRLIGKDEFPLAKEGTVRNLLAGKLNLEDFKRPDIAPELLVNLPGGLYRAVLGYDKNTGELRYSADDTWRKEWKKEKTAVAEVFELFKKDEKMLFVLVIHDDPPHYITVFAEERAGKLFFTVADSWKWGKKWSLGRYTKVLKDLAKRLGYCDDTDFPEDEEEGEFDF